MDVVDEDMSEDVLEAWFDPREKSVDLDGWRRLVRWLYSLAVRGGHQRAAPAAVPGPRPRSGDAGRVALAVAGDGDPAGSGGGAAPGGGAWARFAAAVGAPGRAAPAEALPERAAPAAGARS